MLPEDIRRYQREESINAATRGADFSARDQSVNAAKNEKSKRDAAHAETMQIRRGHVGLPMDTPPEVTARMARREVE